MIDLKRKIAVGLATGAILAQAFAPVAFADINTEIKDNGTNSDNTANVTVNTTVSFTQNNNSYFDNTVDARANTGRNRANGNTNSDVNITTGNADVNVNVTNTGGGNDATINLPTVGNVNTDINHNGNNSTNVANVTKNAGFTGGQQNKCKAKNTVRKKARTGRNRANNNTGGNVDITTGNASAAANVDNACTDNTFTLNP